MKRILIYLLTLCLLCACQTNKKIQSELYPSIPSVSNMHIKEDQKDYLFLEVRSGYQGFQDYIQSCKEEGYIVDASQSKTKYSAFDKTGRRLVLYYFEKERYYSIEVYESKILETLNWRKSDLLPEPKITKGKIEKCTQEEISAYFKMSKEQYAEYVDSCKEFGYNQESIEQDTYYFAKDKKGKDLYLNYLGADTVSVTLVQN